MRKTQETRDIRDTLGNVLSSGRHVIAQDWLVARCGHAATATVAIPLVDGVPDLADLDPIDRSFVIGTAANEFRRMREQDRCDQCSGAQEAGVGG